LHVNALINASVVAVSERLHVLLFTTQLKDATIVELAIKQ